MRIRGRVALLSLILTLAGLTPLGAICAGEKDEKAVRQANTRFYKALNDLFKGDLVRMKAAWSHADDVTYMGPGGGIQVGWDRVIASFETQAAKKLGGVVRPEKINVTVGRDIAIVGCYEVGENVVAGKTQKVSIRATNIFRKENGQWKMIGHHTDLLPFLQQ